MRSVRSSFGRAALVALCLSAATPVLAQEQLADWRQTVSVEHEDRVARLRRVAAEQDISPAPQFKEDVVPAARLPAGFDVDLPVLRVIFDEKSFFDTGSSRVRLEGAPIIRAIAASLRHDVPDVAMFVAGHTDNRGSDAYNYDLSVSRADAVASALYAEGVGEANLWRVGFGYSVPLYPNDTPEHMGFNRRVEFLFSARTVAVLDVLKRQLGHVCAAENAEDALRCKRSIRITHPFEAVQLTDKRVDLPAPPPRRSLPGSRGPASLQARNTKHNIAQNTRLLTLPGVAKKINIEMDIHLLSLPTPRI